MSETLVRAISGSVYVAILLVACWYSEVSYKLLIALFLVLATLEFSRLLRFNSVFGFLISVGLFLPFGYFTNFDGMLDKHFTLFALLTSAWLLVKLFKDSSLVLSSNFTKYLLHIGYVVYPMIIITKIPFNNSVYVPYQIIGVFVLIWSNDTFAYLVGKSIGKTKLLERISPKKTVEGFFGGALFTVLMSVILAEYFFEDSISKWMIQSLIVVVFATLGDLVESKFKRSANVKDSGNIMPGHGGILDRLDSVIFVAPFIFLFHQIFNYVS